MHIDQATVTTKIGFRLRVAGTDKTTGYESSGYYLSNQTSGFAQDNNQTTHIQIAYADRSPSIKDGVCEATIYNPFRTAYTFAHSLAERGDAYSQRFGGWTNVTTSYTGFTIYSVTASNLTGGLSVYGFNK